VISARRAIAAFTGVSLVGTLTQVAKGKITTVLLGASGVGVLSQLTGVTQLLFTAATMSTYDGVIRHMMGHRRAGEGEAMRAQFASVALSVTGLSLLMAAAGALAAPWLSDALFADGGARAGLVALSMLIVPAAALGWCYRVALNAAQDVRAQLRARLTADIASVFVLAALAWWIGLWGAVLGYLALHLVFLAACWRYARRLAPEHAVDMAPRRFAFAELRRNLGYGLAGLGVVVMTTLAALIVGRAIITELGLASNGIYAMAIKVSSVYLGGLASARGGYVYPALNDAEDAAGFDHVLDEALANGLIVVAPLAAGIMLTGEVLMRVLFSAEFVPAAALLLLMLPSDLFRIGTDTLDAGLVARGRLRLYAASQIAAKAIYLAGALALLPHYGLMGVAVAFLAAQALRLAWTLPLMARAVGWRPGPRLWRLGLAGTALCAASAACVVLAPGWGWRLAVGAALLAAWAAALRDDPAMRALLRRLPGRRARP